MTLKPTGFSLVELMVVVALIGILSAMAIPAYTDYTQRARATTALTALQSWQTAIQLCWQQYGQLNTCSTWGQAGIPAPITEPETLPGINSVTAGLAPGSVRAELTVMDRAGQPLVVELRPQVTTTQLHWQLACSDFDGQQEPRLSQCEGHLST